MRLKEGENKITPLKRDLFQFHLMRLKAPSSKRKKIARPVSIPFDAIKRSRYPPASASCFQFQFHLMRLKAWRHCGKTARCRVSIPFDAIKRRRTSFTPTRHAVSIPFDAIKRRRYLHTFSMLIRFNSI